MHLPSFLDVLRSEALKTKGSWGLTLSLLGPLGVSVIILAYSVKESDDLIASESNLWFQLGRYHLNFFFLLYPLFAALVAYLISNIEHRALGFKQLFVQPAPRFYFYVSKLLLLMGWLLVSLVLATGLIYGMGYLLELLYPASPFVQYPPGMDILISMSYLGVALLSILAIHYFLSIYFDNIVIPVGSACFLLVFGMMAARWEYAWLIPYSYFSSIFLQYISGGEAQLFGAREMWISAGYAILFFGMGFGFFSRKQTGS